MSRNKTPMAYIMGDNCLASPIQILTITYDNMPNAMPSEMLAVKGMMIIVMKQGRPVRKWTKSIRSTGLIIITPTRTRALVVAAGGIIRNKGEKKSATKNSRATVNAVSPVRPPSIIPVVLST